MSLGWRVTFVLFVVYVALDLSSPSVIGAFVFEPDDCVESAQASSGRETTDVRLAASLLHGSDAVASISIVVNGPPPPMEIRRPRSRGVSRLCRAMLARVSPLDDPH